MTLAEEQRREEYLLVEGERQAGVLVEGTDEERERRAMSGTELMPG